MSFVSKKCKMSRDVPILVFLGFIILHALFFVSIIRSELGIITTTAVLRRCVKAVTSPQLLQGTCKHI